MGWKILQETRPADEGPGARQRDAPGSASWNLLETQYLAQPHGHGGLVGPVQRS